jgi:hypothetical protein
MLWLDDLEELHAGGTLEGEKFKAGQERKLGWVNPASDQQYTGIIVFPWKVLFEDGSRWTWSFETSQGCFAEFWRDKKHPRLTSLPMEADKVLKKLEAEPQQ